MDKIRKKLGDIKKSDHTDTDELPWGFQNLRKIGKVILALSRQEAAEFPFKGVEIIKFKCHTRLASSSLHY